MAKKKSAGKTPHREQPSFEEALERLETIVAQLEQGELTLDESLKLYEEGVQCIQRCSQQLADAERKVELLMGADADGKPVAQPFDEEQMSLEEKQASRSRRRSTEI